MKNRTSENITREAQFAGQFYPDDKMELQLLLEQLFNETKSFQNKTGIRPNPGALIVPHAGYVFSGKVAASVYKIININANYKRVFVIASSHRYSFGGAAIYKTGHYQTPFGKVQVDINLANEFLKTSALFLEHDESHIYEHSLEVQLPFLQYQLGNEFLLVPIILGTHNSETCREIANVLKPYFTSENLFVISTDFSHYPDYENAIAVDENTSNAICRNEPEHLLQVLNENKKRGIPNLATSLCGWTSVLTLLYLTENKNFSYKKIHYMNSGDSHFYHDKKRVVGYWGILVYENDELKVTEEEKKEILEKAKTAIETYVETGKKNKLIPPLTKGILDEKLGVFVSVYIKKELRGCIGGFAQDKTLNELIQKMSVSASCDHRFEAVKQKELEEMELEISVLSPLKKINSAK